MKSPPPPTRWVLITGASTGIGEQTCADLARAGFNLIVTARNLAAAGQVAQRARDLGAIASALALDVTNAEQLTALPAQVAALVGSAGLYGLVNNAGIAVGGPCELVPEPEWRRQFDVNFFGLVGVTRALLPLLRAARGRIITLSSVSGLNAFPCLAPYAASKFAVEAFSDALRVELQLAQTGVEVVLIEPGPVKTPIWAKRGFTVPAAPGSPYAALIAAFNGLIAAAEEQAAPVAVVSAAITRALTARRPAPRLLVAAGLNQHWLRWLPTRWRDGLIRKSFPTAPVNPGSHSR